MSAIHMKTPQLFPQVRDRQEPGRRRRRGRGGEDAEHQVGHREQEVLHCQQPLDREVVDTVQHNLYFNAIPRRAHLLYVQVYMYATLRI